MSIKENSPSLASITSPAICNLKTWRVFFPERHTHRDRDKLYQLRGECICKPTAILLQGMTMNLLPQRTLPTALPIFLPPLLLAPTADTPHLLLEPQRMEPPDSSSLYCSCFPMCRCGNAQAPAQCSRHTQRRTGLSKENQVLKTHTYKVNSIYPTG